MRLGGDAPNFVNTPPAANWRPSTGTKTESKEDDTLRKSGFQLRNLTPLQKLAIVGSSGMGALRYKPTVNLDSVRTGVSIEELDDIQRKALEILTEKGEGDESLLYYNSANLRGARQKIVMADSDGTHWLVKFRHTYDSAEIDREEFLYMNTAAKCGINVPRTKLLKDRYFAIERFDIEEGWFSIWYATTRMTSQKLQFYL